MTHNQSNMPRIDMAKWGDRGLAPSEVIKQGVDLGSLKPIVISVSEDEIGTMYTAQKGNCNPNLFTQFLLERFKHFGAPVEGTLVFKLAHGAIARVKPNPLQPQKEFRYMWLPAEYVAAIANAGPGNN